MRAPTSPQNGDVLVRQERRDGTAVYIVRIASGTDQYLLRTREEAVVHAVTFAARHGVQAWVLDDSNRYMPLESVGAVAPARSSRQRPLRNGSQPAGG